MKISVTILVKNGSRTLQDVLKSVRTFPEVILIDTGSTDNTLEIAASFPNVQIFKKPFTGFGELHNQATALASNDWILSLDADEVLSSELQKELSTLILNESTLYHIPFHNFFNGKHIKTTSWHPDYLPRLYHRKRTAFSERKVHERIESRDLKRVVLDSPVLHYPYQTVSDFLTKMELYSTLFAEQYAGRKKSSLFISLCHGMGAFLKSYIVKRGIFGGYEGFFISLYNGHTAYYKYLKLYHLNKQQSPSSSSHKQ